LFPLHFVKLLIVWDSYTIYSVVSVFLQEMKTKSIDVETAKKALVAEMAADDTSEARQDEVSEVPSPLPHDIDTRSDQGCTTERSRNLPASAVSEPASMDSTESESYSQACTVSGEQQHEEVTQIDSTRCNSKQQGASRQTRKFQKEGRTKKDCEKVQLCLYS
jgi:hypothetical protein